MKIAFPLLNESELAEDFTHSNYIGIYDSENERVELIPLSGPERTSGATSFFGNLISRGLKLVVSPSYSYMALRVFKENNIEPLKAISLLMAENILHLKNFSLPQYDVYEALLKGPCASDCGKCATTCSTEPEY